MLKPKLFTTLKNYSFQQFLTDSTAGIVVGILALPLAIAFAIASGVSPERGLYAAIIGGFIISALGGSRVQIGGPTGAFIVIVADIVQKHGVNGLLLATMMGGVLLIVLGLARFGNTIKFIPYPLIVGFTSGIALIIFSSQIKDLLGLKMDEIPASFISRWMVYGTHLPTFNLYALGISLSSVLFMFYWKKISRRVPGALIAIALSSVLVYFLGWPVETIGSRFGSIPHALPNPSFPPISIELMKQLSSAALTIALLAGIESLLSAVVADGMIGGTHRSNMELIAQGIANIISPIFGGLPVTGAIARTATNINNGGRTPVAGIVHAIVLFLIMLFLGKLVMYIPLAALAAILVVVAYNMSEWRSFLMILRSPRSDVAVLLTTFALTVIVDLKVAIQVGMVLSAFLFMRRMALVSNVGVITKEFTDDDDKTDNNLIAREKLPKGAQIFEINGPFFFGAANKFIEAMNETGIKSKVRIIEMRNVPIIDATGLHILQQQYKNSVHKGIVFLISGIHSQPFIALDHSGLLEEIGAENVLANTDAAFKRAKEILAQKESSSR